MREIGEYLHRVREAKNISLREIQEATKISLRYLEAIDRGDFEGIPGEVYRKGFLVNFANAIGLDGQEVLQRYNQLKNAREEEIRQVQKQATLQEDNKTSADSEQLKGLYLGIVVALIGILLVLSFFLFPRFQKVGLKEETLPSVPADLSTNADSNAGKTDKQVLPAPITVNALFKERVWMQIKIDGDYLYGADGLTFDPSYTQQVWMAQKEMILKIGNPAGVSLTFNGKELGQLGEEGTVKTIKLTPKGFEAL
ncbi:MAG: helix-turn-helix domain-containing protein [Bacillota bacterium]